MTSAVLLDRRFTN